MRLTSIKLSGFKSFAEPTQFALPGQRVGVVGPNGCGKSNIMDAVRWVLGESKASELRGESMQDVIFNGTTTRKPASRASVELVFDNADHRAGGPWSQYAEIAVRRVLTREGGSSYFLNNQPVRRRDVQDVFLGTGLGPRAYAIIGQGTISRIIESRPEELRLFLEEAAGVSKYKERRRETENRLADTRDNLVRVEDIVRELGGQLERLEAQAEVAQRYKALQAAATLRQQQQWFLKRAEAAAEQERVRAEGLQAVNELEARTAELRQVEAALEALRQSHYAAGEALNQAQGQLYESSAEVGRLEAEIRYVVEGRTRVAQRLETLQEQIAQWEQRAQEAAQEGEDLAARLEAAQEQAAVLEAQLAEQAEQLPALEEAWRAAQARAAEQHRAVLQLQQQLQLLAAEQRSLGEQSRQLDLRLERLHGEQRQLTPPDEAQLQALRAEHEAAQEAAAQAEARLAELQDSVPQRDAERQAQQQAVQAEAAHQATLAARLAALQAVQEKVQSGGKLRPWLTRHGLDGLPALWQRLHIASGWESALEAALRERLGALEVGQLDRVHGFFAGTGKTDGGEGPPARLVFFSPPLAPKPATAATRARLSDLLRLHDPGLQAVLADWLHGCYTAHTLAEALSQREQLAPGERIYLPSGHAVSAHSVDFYAPDSEQAGLLARAQEIEHLEKELRAQAIMGEQARSALARAEAAYAQAQQQLAAARRAAAEAQKQAHALQVQLVQRTQQAEQSRTRSAQIAADRAELEAQGAELQERQATAEARFEELDLQLADSQELEAQQAERVRAAELRWNAAREQQRGLERQAQEADFAQRSLEARRAELARAYDTAQQQLRAQHAELQRANDELARLSDAAAQGGLQQALEQKSAREQALAAARSAYDELTQRLRAHDERRMQLERALDPLRARITELQLKEQAARLGLEQYAGLLADAQADLDALARSVAEGPVRLAGLQPEIERLQREIAALGPVNLAALEELAAARERKQFLDAQTADLNAAMQTLEDAIRTIDAETRELLLGTFDAVNTHFGRMFPELFGGGQARLIMTGDEILNAGVQVMAQPPGKKNQTIHLLSGGEKALTAIALVFAIFQLNPAPFCLLDEVDAPLDDANTERYAKLVTRMSRDTQFLFISHNKIAMEMAEQLVGVTMQEQGVSRIVAVDMESALSLADAS
ncbi:chromosome segregation protein SMC [Extensimonas vulgaris]|uniref:Chromosome partition protein Smc n=1 Tax=Extensimonas vulgaris TaxID=1031594 RepID=A0A369AD76_9BURK|nr:chromosome segregation protein SMC [Extensimonas vulgaris]RCX07289.1 condensin subunit Smc [Extensimonas vulgaris]TWI34564.1 condensin subunit Smc [Extensimonas vulgaris]TXD12759.1 chromosome segregation protein SMC [Extensimonas vulgaris]